MYMDSQLNKRIKRRELPATRFQSELQTYLKASTSHNSAAEKVILGAEQSMIWKTTPLHMQRQFCASYYESSPSYHFCETLETIRHFELLAIYLFSNAYVLSRIS
ncbi:hypothetical protein TNIN_192631 [Trichonephila inaurata madagascariensis]|uniref:Uncharacterized protein n=1 Tax=Trichonephila inaurata madagascariensis TaxID=2747483 RepID=A0A8X6XYK8_9ARAC|nr:hypothetical protein TNIN_192631 [Trichonephila inaurata madagascariensis]